MKTVIWTCIAVFSIMGCYGQRYEVWVNTINRNNLTKGYYGYSNDSVLMIFTKPSLFESSNDILLAWDDITNLKIRNSSKMQRGMSIGGTAGFLIAGMRYYALKKSNDELGILGLIFTSPLYPIVGGYTGRLITNKKADLHLYGMKSNEKNQLLKNYTERQDW